MSMLEIYAANSVDIYRFASDITIFYRPFPIGLAYIKIQNEESDSKSWKP